MVLPQRPHHRRRDDSHVVAGALRKRRTPKSLVTRFQNYPRRRTTLKKCDQLVGHPTRFGDDPSSDAPKADWALLASWVNAVMLFAVEFGGPYLVSLLSADAAMRVLLSDERVGF